jgi:large conductance mechanosensitive channel
MPPIGVITGGVDFSSMFVALNGEHYDSLAQARQAGAPTMNFGLFINSVISFTIVAFVLFMVVKAMNHLRRKQEEDPAAKQPLSRDVAAGDQRRSSQRRRRRGAWQDAETRALGRAKIFRFQRIARLRRFAKQARKKKNLLSGF